MIKKIFLFTFLLLIFNTTAYAEMMLFTSEKCSHCLELKDYLSANDLYNLNDIKEYEIYQNKNNQELYLKKSKELNYTAGGVPLLIDGNNYVEGNNPIREYLANIPQTEIQKTTIGKQDVKNIKESNDVTKNPITLVLISTAAIGLFVFLKKRN
ncbi:hypothetical protein COU74_00990 [Candidatus Peregrinibacteria bacterium CG10_big_fil_rev_8_21_14_0_10_36_19]|nr:MAG: hypothetical protein COU74_00990 [Candidatus Peregrinibacteria bacterium CG10_big_fil_rev_8_21_14_0_10_36_19]